MSSCITEMGISFCKLTDEATLNHIVYISARKICIYKINATGHTYHREKERRNEA